MDRFASLPFKRVIAASACGLAVLVIAGPGHPAPPRTPEIIMSPLPVPRPIPQPIPQPVSGRAEAPDAILRPERAVPPPQRPGGWLRSLLRIGYNSDETQGGRYLHGVFR